MICIWIPFDINVILFDQLKNEKEMIERLMLNLPIAEEKKLLLRNSKTVIASVAKQSRKPLGLPRPTQSAGLAMTNFLISQHRQRILMRLKD